MKTARNTFHANLFYSYSHRDARYRQNMETALSQLRREQLLQEWSDLNIIPGQPISSKIREKMDEADIFVFLLSPDFIDSDECMREWKHAKQLSAEGKLIFRIPIIVRDCAWKDLLRNDNVKALPEDGTAVANFDNEDTAWMQVYEGIKDVINELKRAFIPKLEFIREMEKTDFAAEDDIRLQDVFVFPTLLYFPPETKSNRLEMETITDREDLLAKKYTLIHGADMSGKTALSRSLYLSLAEDPSTPVLYIDLQEVSRKPEEKVFSDAYYRQFSGDYSLWKQQKDKTLILDDLSSAPRLIELIELARDLFDKIIITLSTDIFYAFFRDETRLADYDVMEIQPLRHRQQEQLIRKRLALSNRNQPVSDGLVDRIENDVNAIITSKKIVPRYPFFVLSILQTYEGFMPDDLSITSYGYCYQVLIVATLRKAGISMEDYAINTCYNFAEKLAFKIYQNTKSRDVTQLDFNEFVKEYREEFIIEDAILSRLIDDDYGIISTEGNFKMPYIYYFFLGGFLSKKGTKNEDVIKEMCKRSHVKLNYLTLLFIIHHTNDNNIIDDILRRIARALDRFNPARLTPDETISFNKIVDALPEDISSPDREEKRNKRSDVRDNYENLSETEEDLEEIIDEHPLDDHPLNDIYRILKNNEIMGQILRNRYGSLEKTKIRKVIKTVADSGLRIVKFLLLDEDQITRVARHLHRKFPDSSDEEIKQVIRYASFLWTMAHVQQIVSSINVPGIREVVNEVVQQKSTPAYDLIGYFNHLDSVEALTNGIRRDLEDLLKRHDDSFLQRVLSLETQYYMNTHRSPARIEQSVCALLKIRYAYRPPSSGN